MLIEFERTGGFSGMRLATIVDTASLARDEAQVLHNLVADAGFFDLPGHIERADTGADRFQYALTVQASGQQHTVEVGESAIPDALRPLIDKLTTLARSGRHR
jgi:hypothetical protein